MRLDQRLNGVLPLTRGPVSKTQAIKYPPPIHQLRPLSPLAASLPKTWSFQETRQAPLSVRPHPPKQRLCIQLPEEEVEN